MALPYQSKMVLPHVAQHGLNKAMLTGQELGAAIETARQMKGVTKAALASAMGVKPASVQDWVKYGRIAKNRVNDLVTYFSDVVGPEHWGLEFGPLETESKKSASLTPLSSGSLKSQSGRFAGEAMTRVTKETWDLIAQMIELDLIGGQPRKRMQQGVKFALDVANDKARSMSAHTRKAINQ
ncbi:hypothetical protein [Burkholderia pseudomallei]|uniref:hypothetical protein n=1 Tax=Burkholderia pseudomallei TaxID=28450 RepID=UPI001177CCA1|nr:hypothetical protein [Burkholderia pseudomallei]